MRLHLMLPRVEPTDIALPSICPLDGCEGAHFRFHQKVRKPVRDTVYQAVSAHRYQCLRCGRAFRVYPRGVSRVQTSQRAKGLAVVLYLWGLSYGAVSLVMEALGMYVCKSRVYDVGGAGGSRAGAGLEARGSL